MGLYFLRRVESIILIVLIVTLFLSCDEEVDLVNIDPTCSLTSPSNNAEFEQGEQVVISVNASDTDGTILEVNYNIDDSSSGTSTVSPFEFIWNTTGVQTGIHTIMVTVKDNDGGSASCEISVLISEVPTVTDYDGNIYEIVEIGSQWWMAENLNTTHYADGTEIAIADVNLNWDALGDDFIAYNYANNNDNNESATYGAQYTWAAAMNGLASSDNNPSGVRGVCPTGWHMPSDSEWKELEGFLGMLDVDEVGVRGTNEGSKLAGGVNTWFDGVLVNDPSFGTSGFNVLAGGRRTSNFYLSINISTTFWTSTAGSSSAGIERGLDFRETGIFRGINRSKKKGYYVRCVKDD